MAYNNPGDQYQSNPGQQQWSAAHGQQGIPQAQQPRYHQYQQQSNQYVRPAQAIYSDYRPAPSSPQIRQPSPQQIHRQYQFQTTTPVGTYPSMVTRQDSVDSPYGSPQQSFSASPQQFVQTYNQQIPGLPQRQLSYPVPQQQKKRSMQHVQSPIAAGPVYSTPQFQGYPQSPATSNPRSLPNHVSPDLRHSQSPVSYNQRSPQVTTFSGQASATPQALHVSQQQQFVRSPPVPVWHQNQNPSPIIQHQNQNPSPILERQNLNQSTITQHPNPSPVIRQQATACPTPISSASPRPAHQISNQAIQAQSVTRPISVDKAKSGAILGQAIPQSQTHRLHKEVQSSTVQSSSTQITSSQRMPQIKNINEQPKMPQQHAKPPKAVGRTEIALAKQSTMVKPAIIKPEVAPLTRTLVEEQQSAPITDIDYALLLLDLADEYFEAAYGRPTSDDPARREPDLHVFHKLIATGLGCLEIVLRQWRQTLQPAVEAAVRLKYASTLFAETDNTSEAEECLSKGIAQCDKLRLHDLKYNMQHLLARITFTTNAKAAGRYLDAAITDAEVQNHWPWVYAFRFLRVSLSLGTNQSHETIQALHSLKIITTAANRRGDIAIAATACAMEAMIHISQTTDKEVIEHAQAALAAVRTAENNRIYSIVPQISVMAYFVDLYCSLFKAESDAAHAKMKAMHLAMDKLSSHEGWTMDDTFLVPVSQLTAKSMPNSSMCGMVVSGEANRTYIKLSWLSKNELYAIANMLGAETLIHKYQSIEKCEEFLDNAREYLKLAGEESSDDNKHTSIQFLMNHIQMLRVFAACVVSAWAEARKRLNILKDRMTARKESTSTVHQAFVIYLEGMMAQGTGDTNKALALYADPLLALKTSKSSRSPVLDDLAILAIMNTILIIHRPDHPRHKEMAILLEVIEDVETTNPSLSMRGCLYFMRALNAAFSDDRSTQPIINTKNNLAAVLQLAKSTGVSQFSIMGLTFMSDRFFSGHVGPQADSMVTVSQNLATRARSDLWTSVTLGYKAASLEVRGNTEEAEKVKKEAMRLAMRLPASMQVLGD